MHHRYGPSEPRQGPKTRKNSPSSETVEYSVKPYVTTGVSMDQELLHKGGTYYNPKIRATVVCEVVVAQ